MKSFASRIIHWQQQHGRHSLPWQACRDPYRIWLSEIMLQQTQVATVIPYFHRFISRFPDLSSLADADQDEVLQLWSGLGYYSRARNLHDAARIITSQHGDWDRLAESCRTAKGLAVRFPLLLEFVSLDTGNVWLDTNWECCWEEYPWEETAMEYLKKEKFCFPFPAPGEGQQPIAGRKKTWPNHWRNRWNNCCWRVKAKKPSWGVSARPRTVPACLSS